MASFNAKAVVAVLALVQLPLLFFIFVMAGTGGSTQQGQVDMLYVWGLVSAIGLGSVYCIARVFIKAPLLWIEYLAYLLAMIPLGIFFWRLTIWWLEGVPYVPST